MARRKKWLDFLETKKIPQKQPNQQNRRKIPQKTTKSTKQKNTSTQKYCFFLLPPLRSKDERKQFRDSEYIFCFFNLEWKKELNLTDRGEMHCAGVGQTWNTHTILVALSAKITHTVNPRKKKGKKRKKKYLSHCTVYPVRKPHLKYA
eukprot:GEMP01031224.1.p1 GENE.GEMP01031224.1~~GEMP01031224.1.p1  ORF type:complete len:148 (+),score=1.53 GEMP01031224.1:386-829(+)